MSFIYRQTGIFIALLIYDWDRTQHIALKKIFWWKHLFTVGLPSPRGVQVIWTVGQRQLILNRGYIRQKQTAGGDTQYQ